MEFIRKNLAKLIEAALLLTLGILLIVAGAGNGGAGDAISVIIGIVALIVGSLSLALVAFVGIKNKASFAGVGIGAASLIGLGISLLVGKYALDLVTLLLFIMPYVLVVVGLVLVCDGLICLIRNSKAKEGLVPAVVNIVTGAVATTIGFLCMSFGGNAPVIGTDVQLIIIGIVVVVSAALTCLLVFVGNKK